MLAMAYMWAALDHSGENLQALGSVTWGRDSMERLLSLDGAIVYRLL